jgi:Uri superfamily endonuclease
MISSAKSRKLAKDPGTYALVLYLPRAMDLRIGKLGRHKFPRGYYLYIGSALNGLTMRIMRHMSDDKIKHWHIDYLLEHALVKQLWTHRGAERFECVWAQAALAMPNARVVAPRFGASDCKCAAHLVYFGNRPPMKKG